MKKWRKQFLNRPWKDEIRRLLTENWGLKILAFVFAVGLWFSVVNINDPEQTKRFNVPVTVINDNVLTDAGKYYEIADDSGTVSVRVTANRSVMDKLSASDFTATADMTRLENDSQIPIEISLSKYSGQVSLSARTYYLYVTVGKMDSYTFEIEASAVGTPADGYTIGGVSSSPNVITIEGPEDEVSQVDSVQAFCDVTGRNKSVTENVMLVLYDDNGDRVPTGNLSMSISTVDVTVEILSVKSVEINVETSGTLSEELSLKEITTNPAEVTIMGSSDAVNDISSITIPGSMVDLSSVTADKNIVVDITSLLPENVTLADNSDSKVTVSIVLEGETTTTISVPTSNIDIENIKTGAAANFTSDSFTLQLTGIESVLSQVSASNITGTADVSGLNEGTHSVIVSLNLPEGVTTQDVTLRIEISSEETGSEESTEEENGEEN